MKTTQNKSTFTPGPWEVKHNIGRKNELGVIADNAPCIIATMCSAKAWPVEAKANARLIAAAPTEHECLKRLLFDLKEVHEEELRTNHHGDGPDGCLYCDDIQQAEAVIAEVEEE